MWSPPYPNKYPSLETVHTTRETQYLEEKKTKKVLYFYLSFENKKAS